jgi:hypothetical protein
MAKRARRSAGRRPAKRRVRGGGAAPATVQYTVRSVPAHVDRALRRKAQEGRKSLTEVLRDALIREAGGPDLPARVYTDLDALAGSWVDIPGFEDAIATQDLDEATLVRFLDSRRVDLMFADEDTTHHYARLFQQLRRQGTPIPTNDLWIAGTAKENP